MRAIKLAAATAAIVMTVGACTQRSAGSDEHRDATATVVASTDVWGSVASAVAGGHATVKSIVTGTVADPHSFEPSPADAAEIADASLVIYNGGGYDQWVDDVLANHRDVANIDAYSLLNTALLNSSEQPANEHVFYDPATAKAVAVTIAERLAEADSGHADLYRANAAAFGKGADEITAAERAIGQAAPGVSVAATEPVAHYLLVNAGVADKTPEGFTSAIEEDTDPSPADLAAMLDLIDTGQVAALLNNPQTQTAVTKQIEDAARRAAIPVVTITETLPAGTDYLTWQRQTADELAGALQTNR